MDEVQLFQLTVVGGLAVVLFIGAYSMPQTVAATILLVMIPIQPIETQYATANVVLTWVVFTAMLMRGDRVRLVMLPQILIVLFVYLLSMGVQDTSTYTQHAIFIFNLITAFLVLWIAYDLCQRVGDINKVIQVLLAMNVLVCIYCLIQMTSEPGHPYVVFGIDEMTMLPIIKENRLTGPFGGPGILAEFLVMMVFLVAHQILSSIRGSYRLFLIVLAVTNLGLLVATANRGGFLTLIGGSVLFLWLFRKVLGPARTVRIALGGSALLSIAAVVAINFTQYDAMFTRLAETEIEGGMPETRAIVWPIAWREIQTHPVLGHGPRLRFVDDKTGKYNDVHKNIPYPHNLYLFLLFTVGTVGAIAFLIFLLTPLYRCWQTSRQLSIDQDSRNLARIGLVVMVVFFVDQMKIEFIRFALTDYWHFIFAIIGIMCAVGDRSLHSRPQVLEN